MTKKTRTGVHDNDPAQSAEPRPVAAPAARRRLLRALGGSGGVALGAILGARWHEPVVEAVVLPAHAQTSTVETVGCVITVSVSATGSVITSGTDGTMNIFVQSGGVSTELASAIVPSGATTASLSGAATFPPGTYGANGGVTRPGAAFQSLAVNWSCCDDTASANLGISASSVGLFRVADISDDGQCELSVTPG